MTTATITTEEAKNLDMNHSERISPKDYARLRGITLQAVYMALAGNRIPGAKKIGKEWEIPKPASRSRTAVTTR